MYKTANLPEKATIYGIEKIYTKEQREDSKKSVEYTLTQNGFDMNLLKDVVEIPIYADSSITWGTFFGDNLDEVKALYPMLRYETSEQFVKVSDYNKIARLYGQKEYELKDKNFPTIDPNDPYKLTKEEEYVMEHLVTVFKYCAYLQEHIRFLFAKGHLYKVFNGMLLYHGCVPLNEDGTFREVEIEGRKYAGKELYDVLEHLARQGYYEEKDRR